MMSSPPRGTEAVQKRQRVRRHFGRVPVVERSGEVLKSPRLLELGNLCARGIYELRVGVGMASESPTAVNRLGK
jgi:hypothetical protein